MDQSAPHPYRDGLPPAPPEEPALNGAQRQLWQALGHDGVAVDTSFGMSPQSGLPQNNRCGDLDVFAALFVMKKRGLGPDEMARVLEKFKDYGRQNR